MFYLKSIRVHSSAFTSHILKVYLNVNKYINFHLIEAVMQNKASVMEIKSQILMMFKVISLAGNKNKM